MNIELNFPPKLRGTLQGSFSAVSTPIFASEYSFDIVLKVLDEIYKIYKRLRLSNPIENL